MNGMVAMCCLRDDVRFCDITIKTNPRPHDTTTFNCSFILFPRIDILDILIVFSVSYIWHDVYNYLSVVPGAIRDTTYTTTYLSYLETYVTRRI